jgi:glycosyltransferase involved in cell wall biosynthesis
MRVGGVHGLGGRVRSAVTRRVFRRWVHAVYVNSDDVAAHLLRVVPGLPAARVVRIANALEPREASPADLRGELGLPADALLLLGVGGLERRKGFDIAVQALALPGLEAPHLVLAGDGPARAPLQRQAEALGVADRLHLLGQRTDVPALLRAVDAFVLPSRREGMPVALMEAMAAGLPAVATRAGGVAELLERGGPPAGWVVPVNDAPALAAALRELLSDPAAARTRAAAARQRVLTDYTVDRLVTSLERLLAAPHPYL